MENKKKKRSYSEQTKKKLYAVSLNRCYNPDCTNKVIAKDSNISEIAHIRGLEPGSARYEADMTDDKRNSYQNLILLCGNCHKIVDDQPDKYTAELLKSWKTKREAEACAEKVSEEPSLLAKAVLKISRDCINSSTGTGMAKTPFVISEKIEYNHLVINKEIISKYSGFFGKLDKIYKEFEQDGRNLKFRLLEKINDVYLRVKGEFSKRYKLEGMALICKHSDDIYDEVVKRITEEALSDGSNKDDIGFAVPIIVADAFTRCKILEAPK